MLCLMATLISQLGASFQNYQLSQCTQIQPNYWFICFFGKIKGLQWSIYNEKLEQSYETDYKYSVLVGLNQLTIGRLVEPQSNCGLIASNENKGVLVHYTFIFLHFANILAG